MSENEQVQDLMEKLRQQRDELRLKVHLGKADAKDEWNELEEKWEGLKARLKAAGGEAGEAKEDVSEAMKGLMDEIKKGYGRIRDKL